MTIEQQRQLADDLIRLMEPRLREMVTDVVEDVIAAALMHNAQEMINFARMRSDDRSTQTRKAAQRASSQVSGIAGQSDGPGAIGNLGSGRQR